MTPDERDEIEALAHVVVRSAATGEELARLPLGPVCGAPSPYGVTTCERPPGHRDRHWNDRLNWPAA